VQDPARDEGREGGKDEDRYARGKGSLLCMRHRNVQNPREVNPRGNLSLPLSALSRSRDIGFYTPYFWFLAV